MNIFSSPLYMALSYEENQGPLHSLVAQVLRDISTYVNASSVKLSRKVIKTTRIIFSNLTTTMQKKVMNSFFPNLTAPLRFWW